MSTDTPQVVYVDLIKDEPDSFAVFSGRWLVAPIGGDDDDVGTAYSKYVDRFQPFRWHSTNAGNHEILGHGERYFNEADALANITQQYGSGTTVYLRRAEHGNELLRMAYPRELGDEILLGPGVAAGKDGSYINWNGIEYVKAVTE